MSGKKDQKVPSIRYAHENHAAFNKALAARQKSKSPELDISAPWMPPETLFGLPRVHKDFDVSRDPAAAKKLDEAKKNTANRGGQDGRGSTMVKRDKPSPEHRPPPEMRRSVDQRQFNDRWLAEERDAVMRRAADIQPFNSPAHTYARGPQGPSR